MKKTLFLISVLFAAVISGCTNYAPDCSDPQTKNLVTQIVGESLTKILSEDTDFFQMVANSKNMVFHNTIKQIKLSLTYPITIDKNNDTGAYVCKGTVEAEAYGKTESVPISYTSEITDSGNNFYVTVADLPERKQGILLTVLMTK